MSAEPVVATVAAPNPNVVPLIEDHVSKPEFTPEKLLDAMLDRFGLKNDAALARTLKLPPPVISKLRLRHVSLSAAVLVRMHDVTGWTIARMRELAGIESTVEPA